MRVISAVGNGEESTAALHLLGRLDFEAISGRLVHVIEQLGVPTLNDGVHVVAANAVTHFLKLQHESGKERLKAAAGVLARYGVTLEPTIRSGFVANELMSLADSDDADLIAVGNRDQPRLQKFLTGSVTRKLVVKARQSLLVARPLKRSTGPVTAVVAADHSPYGDRCLDLLPTLRPKGIREMVVLSAYPKQLVQAMGSVLQSFKADVVPMIERHIGERNDALAVKLEPLGARVTTRISDLSVSDAIAEAVSESGAELVVLGAQGHGFFQRLTLGSVSFEQVTSGTVSTLVLRAPDTESTVNS